MYREDDMNKPDDADELDQVSGSIDGFEKRAQRILDQLDRTDRILDNLQVRHKKTDKATEIFEEIFESLERGIRKLFSTSLSEVVEPENGQKSKESLSPEDLARHLRSYPDKQLVVIKREIDRILNERGVT